MKINFLSQKIDGELKSLLRLAAKTTLRHIGQQDRGLEMNIAFISSEEMRSLNARTRQIDKVTDVLSFPNYSLKPFEKLKVPAFLGDVAICLERAESQAPEFNNTTNAEVTKLVIHSVLHLMGFDHIKDEDFEVMNKCEKEIATKLAGQIKIC